MESSSTYKDYIRCDVFGCNRAAFYNTGNGKYYCTDHAPAGE